MNLRRDISSLPNMVSALRILLAPLLFLLALLQLPWWFLGVLMLSGLTDMLDGILARRLRLTSPLGARLDSWGDFTNYFTMAVCAWILWPEVTREVLVYYSMILFSFLLPAWAGLVKFGRFTGYHTWAVKVAVLVTFGAYLALYSGIARWPFALAGWLSAIAGIEEILITLLLRRERTDVRSALVAWRLRNSDH